MPKLAEFERYIDQLCEILGHQEDAERSRQTGENEAVIGVVELQHAEDLMAGDQDGLLRNRQAEEHDDEKDVATREVQPRKTVAGERRQDQCSECQPA